jgi:hypothetical protein
MAKGYYPYLRVRKKKNKEKWYEKRAMRENSEE